MDQTLELVKEIEFNFTRDQFWDAVDVWRDKPHTLNKRVLCIDSITQFNTQEFGESHIQHIKSLVQEHQGIDCFNAIDTYCHTLDNGNMLVDIRKLFPRSAAHFESCVEIVVIDSDTCSVHFYNLTPTHCKPAIVSTFPYSIQYDSGGRKVYLKVDNSKIQPEQTKVCPKVEKTTLPMFSQRATTLPGLKDTLLPKLVFWPEVTDPNKFVYEDIAIATYLFSVPTSFVDLGCGNGLLVHILNSEGHHGFGIDVRKRKIWDLYPPSTVLKVDVINPSCSTVFPHIDWIIGNHSDELTPWIPVITTRSHQQCKMFLLPCCAYQFNGRKYQRRNSKRSTYKDYLHYITEDVCDQLCGFQVQVDRLRIPSTKRIAIVCQSRKYTEQSDYEIVDKRIRDFLEQLDSGEKSEEGIDAKEGEEGEERGEGIENDSKEREDKEITGKKVEDKEIAGKEGRDKEIYGKERDEQITGKEEEGKEKDSKEGQNKETAGKEEADIEMDQGEEEIETGMQAKKFKNQMAVEKEEDKAKRLKTNREESNVKGMERKTFKTKRDTNDFEENRKKSKTITETSHEVEEEVAANQEAKEMEQMDFKNLNTNTNKLQTKTIEDAKGDPKLSENLKTTKPNTNPKKLETNTMECAQENELQKHSENPKTNAKSWLKTIKTRDTHEAVRNCTQIDRSIETAIVDLVVAALLARQTRLNTSWADENDNYGIAMGELIKVIKERDESYLRAIARQNGGIQTLLRNRHEMFLVQNGSVLFRKPIGRDRNAVGAGFWKSKPCWFLRNHPFQCPLSGEQCSFIH
ncbi:uncharacterized protein LOC103510060 [Diaphorina citri]|uniref:tRNA (uracil-O(2)-)-methyltransferase n=1 Tax=Diaphorina citri TaxID=121845 RepID=A0A3Q0IZB2_DIACI|nr:uncharacterized protein LOC103510060 [Diaphorina citri]